MKSMRTIIILVISLLSTVLIAQNKDTEQLVVPLSNSGEKGQLEVQLVNGSITVSSYDGNEVIINASAELQETTSKKLQNGMKKLNTNSFSISAEEKNNKIEIETNSWRKAIYLDIQVITKISYKLEF